MVTSRAWIFWCAFVHCFLFLYLKREKESRFRRWPEVFSQSILGQYLNIFLFSPSPLGLFSHILRLALMTSFLPPFKTSSNHTMATSDRLLQLRLQASFLMLFQSMLYARHELKKNITMPERALGGCLHTPLQKLKLRSNVTWTRSATSRCSWMKLKDIKPKKALIICL